MIEIIRNQREDLLQIGTLTLFWRKDFGGGTTYILYDIFDNGEEFVEIWIKYNEVMHR
jgi:hypothetical protein